MKADDRIYQLFAEANPAPPTVVAAIDRPSADALLHDTRRTPMLTQEPRLRDLPPLPRRRRNGPAIAAAAFAIVVAVFGVALWLGGRDGDTLDPTDQTTVTTTTEAPQTTTTTTVPTPPTVLAPDLVGMTLADARAALAELGVEIQANPPAADGAYIFAQDPVVGTELQEGDTVVVDARMTLTCEPMVPSTPQSGQAEITVLFQCGGDSLFPTEYVPLQRLVPLGNGEAIDRIEWTLRSLLNGPAEEERMAGFSSFFGLETSGALDSVTLADGHVVADFNDAIIVNNAGTSTGSVFFNAELRANLFQYPEVDSVEFRLNGSCEDWSRLFEGDGCWIITRDDWNQQVADWEAQRSG